jgi:hypothetical protein
MKKIFFFLMFFVLCFSAITFSIKETSMNMEFVESGSVIHYYNKYHVVQVEGTITITNPTSSTYFGIRVPFKDTVLNYKQVMSAEDTQYLIDDYIFIISISPNQSITFKYMVTGITNINPVKNGSVMQSIIDTENILSFNDIRVSLLKAPVENESSGGKKDQRIITVRIENPTGVDINLTHIEVIKTPSLNVTNVMNRWVFPVSKQSIFIPSQGVWEDDIVDTNAHDGEVYWIDYEVEIYKVIFDFDAKSLMEINITLIDQLNRTSNMTNISDESQYIFILKEISSSVVQPGDIIEILLTILNVGDIPKIVNIQDLIPAGFEFYMTPSGTVEGNAFKDTKLVGPGSTININYSIKYVGDGQVGLGFFDGAVLKFGDKNISSGKLSFIKEYLPKERLFVQKKISHVNDDDIKVELLLKNIGQSAIKNIVLKEALTIEDRFEMISRSSIDKGVWSIQEIMPNEEYMVEYVTGSKTQYNILPNIFGLSDEEIYKTLITDTILKNIFRANKTNAIEIVGLAFVFVFIVFMFFINFRWLEKLKNIAIKGNDNKISTKISSTSEVIKSLKQDLATVQNQNLQNAANVSSNNAQTNSLKETSSPENAIQENKTN